MVVAVILYSAPVRTTLSTLLLSFPLLAQAAGFADCPQFFPFRPPVVAGHHLRELCFSEFAVLHSGQTRTPVYVAQRLDAVTLQQAKSLQRFDKFYADARLPRSERAELADYKGSGWSRGHMAPAGDMGTFDGKAQSFSLANIAPQDRQHNAGAWTKIEKDTRRYIERAQGNVFVFTGPIYSQAPETIGASRVAVPTAFFKLVYDAATRHSWAHIQNNSSDARPGKPVGYSDFVQRTGLRLLD